MNERFCIAGRKKGIFMMFVGVSRKKRRKEKEKKYGKVGQGGRKEMQYGL